jgi:hypothetical protein
MPFIGRHLENLSKMAYYPVMKLTHGKIPGKPSLLKNSALVVLVVFCSLLFLQTACTAGVISHCDHHRSHDRNLDHCDHDRCGDNYPVPGKIGTKVFVSYSPLYLAAFKDAVDVSGSDPLKPYCQPIIINSPRPAGTFPLLI